MPSKARDAGLNPALGINIVSCLFFLMKRKLLDIDDLKVFEGSEGMFSIDELSQEEKVRLVD